MTVAMQGDRLLAVFRFTDHADPMYCVCGHTWGHHGQFGRYFGGGFSSTPRTLNVTDCSGAGNNVCDCMAFRYDANRRENKIVKVSA